MAGTTRDRKMNLAEIQELIKFVAKSGVSEVEIEQKEFKITIKTDPNKGKRGKVAEVQQHIITQPMPVQQPVMMPPAQQPAAPPAAAPEAKKEEAVPVDEGNYVTFKAPMIGTFYRSAGPDKPTFVNVGDKVKKGQTLCIIEAMKLFNEIESEVDGTIVKVLVDDAKPIEYDQPLFLIEPA